MRSSRTLGVGLVVLASLPAPVVPAAAESATPEPLSSGARIVAVERLDERTVDVTVDSPAVGVAEVRLLLPAAFDPDADRDWPVLYLLHGAMDDYTSWTRETDVAELTAELDLLVVMPEAGDWGWYSDWYAGDGAEPPRWETFHLDEVRELIERDWQAGTDRLVAGLSMGGFGAMSYAGRRPELFRGAASFSGLLDLFDDDVSVDAAVWGAPGADGNAWARHDPVTLAPALEGMTLYVSYGSGEVGPLDGPGAVRDRREAWLARTNEAFVARLDELDIPITVEAYGRGTHAWPYWERALHAALPLLLDALGR